LIQQWYIKDKKILLDLMIIMTESIEFFIRGLQERLLHQQYVIVQKKGQMNFVIEKIRK